jgi:hypothetical protein
MVGGCLGDGAPANINTKLTNEEQKQTNKDSNNNYEPKTINPMGRHTVRGVHRSDCAGG